MSHHPRPEAIALDVSWVQATTINRSAVERRCASHVARRSVKQEYQLAWLLRAITCIDLTTLAGDDTVGTVQRLCAKARQPVRQDLLDALGMTTKTVHVGAVCVYHEMIAPAVTALAGSGIPVAAVSTGFPAGLSPFETRVREIELSVAAGAAEIDIVISRRHVLEGNWQALYDEIKTFRAACGDAHLKTILGTGDMGTLTDVARASLVCMMAGADVIKTSTGKEPTNATLPVSLVMLRAIREFHQRTGQIVGFKPAGGIRTAKQALDWLLLVEDELGREWLDASRFRFGASALLGDIERQLEHGITGRYSAANRHAQQ
jgi:deoxyribose-phosphate aldolase